MIYVYSCPKCDTTYELVMRLADHKDEVFDWCPRHGHQDFQQLLTPQAIEDWGCEGTEGRYFEHLSHEGMHFRDKRSYNEHLRKNGLAELGRKPGMPGCEV
jgi:hypothetical protein